MKIGINIWMLLGAWPRLDKSICSQVFEVLNDPFHFEFRLPSLERFSQMAHLFLSESLTCGCGSICCYPKTNGWKTYLTTHIDMYSETKKKKKYFFPSFLVNSMDLWHPLTFFYPWIMENLGEDFLTLNVARAAKTTGTPCWSSMGTAIAACRWRRLVDLAGTVRMQWG